MQQQTSSVKCPSIQYLSDIHLELTRGRLSKVPVPRVAPILVLAGDIGNPFHTNYGRFLWQCSNDFEHVVVVLGNHEYYQPRRRRAQRSMHDVEKKVLDVVGAMPNVHFLHNSSVSIDGVVFYGTPLWTHIPPEHAASSTARVRDFTAICNFSVRKHNDLHADSLARLSRFLAQTRGQRVVVVTHHCPLWVPHPTFGMEDAHAFKVDLTALIERWAPTCWIYGHTHERVDRRVGNTLVVTNARGVGNEFRPSHNSLNYPIAALTIYVARLRLFPVRRWT